MSVITAWSPLIGTPINLVRGLIRLGPIKDLNLDITVCRPFGMAEKGLERKVELPGIEPRASGLPCKFSATELQVYAAAYTCLTPLHSLHSAVMGKDLRPCHIACPGAEWANYSEVHSCVAPN